MKVDFKLNRITVIAICGLLARYDITQFESLNKREKTHYAMRLDLRSVFFKKSINCHPSKEFKMKLVYYLADELLDIIREYQSSGLYNNGLEMLKNQLAPKLL